MADNIAFCLLYTYKDYQIKALRALRYQSVSDVHFSQLVLHAFVVY